MRILTVIPHATLLSAAGCRARLEGLLGLLQGEEITFLLPEQTPVEDRAGMKSVHLFHEPELAGRPVPFFLGFSRSFSRALRAALAASKAQLVVFLEPWGGEAAGTGIPIVYFSQGIERDFSPITLQHLGCNIWPIRPLFRALIGFLERRVCRRSSLIIAMSKIDASIYEREFFIPAEKILALPQPAERRTKARDSITARRALGLPESGRIALFHGSWAHVPNRQAVDSLRREIVPRLREAGNETLVVTAGTGMPRFKEDGIVSLGFVENLETLLDSADFAVVPVYAGSGVRMKILDYFRGGLPVISTAKGIEGLEVKNNIEAVITADNASSMTKAIINLQSLEPLREAAWQYLEREHSPAVLRGALMKRLQPLSADASAMDRLDSCRQP